MSNYLIIGASSGIGSKLAEQLVGSGHKVLATYFKNKPEPDAGLITYHYLNVLDEINPLDFLPDTLEGLVYCPGSINLRPFERIKPSGFVDDFNLQVIGAIKIIQAAIPQLKKAGNASIVLFSTVAVQSGFPFHTQVSASKGAIEGLTRALAAEYAPKIRVNCIAPSLTDTPLAASMLNTDQKREANALRHPLKKTGTPENIADMAEFLLSGKGSWITGQIFHVDGGMSSLKV
ncbi:MAG: SDR family oxidoreductase [Bacteroidales bacterium]|nr:SDR family oxidoreductase [Bacteroidales bacterium]